MLAPVMARPHSERRLPLGGFAAAGLVLGHGLTYVLSFRDPLHREVHLADAGHRYWAAAIWIAAALAVWSLGRIVLRSLRSTTWTVPGTTGGIIVRLAALQISLFVGLEILERTASATPMDDLVHRSLLWVGLGAQLVLAIAGALLVRALARAVRFVADLVASRPASEEALLRSHAPAPVPAPVPLLVSGWGVRGPPVGFAA